VVAPIAIGSHRELALFFVTRLSPDNPVIFGLPWLQRHNPNIDWAQMSLTFSSPYCRRYCLTGSEATPAAPIIPSPPIDFHDLAPEALSTLKGYRPPTVEDAEDDDLITPGKKTHRVIYRVPTVEDEPEDQPEPLANRNAPDLRIDMTLTPGQQHYRTFAPNGYQGPEHRAQMVPNCPNIKPAPAPILAGRRRRGKPLPKPILPPLSVPLPAPPAPSALLDIRPDLTDIRVARATNFLQFCRDPSVKAMRLTWDELDSIQQQGTRQKRRHTLPDLPEEYWRMATLGQGDWKLMRTLFPEDLHDFVDECYSPLRLNKITEADIEKFMKGKPELTQGDIVKRLPDWLRDLSDAFLPRLADELPPRRSWDHKIELLSGTEPPYSKTRPMSPDELRVVRKWLDDNLAKGFIRESRARCAAPLLLAAKPGGGVRVCQDYRGLNSITIKNRYPLPLIRETLDAICKAKVYTKLDIIAAFNKLRIAEGHEWKTAFITRFGLFETLVMPFGLCNAPASFQHYINHVLFDLLDKIATAYLDDVLIYSSSRKEHRAHVREVVERLRDAGLQIDITKCEFETTRTKYLGLIITPGGIEMDQDKVATIKNWKPPPGLKDLQRFLGFANFYRRFIRDFSKICSPLNELLRKGVQWNWDTRRQEAFDTLKQAFISAPVLAMFDYTRKTVLETDASDWASGGILSQYDDDGSLRPVAYFSSKHLAPECNYEIYDKELLAIIKALEEWRPELQGSREPFEVVTDHKNLEYFTTTKALNQRQVRWSEFLSQFNFRIVYRPGSKAIRPDALSRKAEDRPSKANPNDERLKNRQRTLLPPDRFDPAALADLLREADDDVDFQAAAIDLILPAMDKPIDELIDRAYDTSEQAAAMLAALQDPAVKRWPRALRPDFRVAMTDFTVVNGKIYYRNRLYAPPDDELRTQILYRTHSTGPAGHPGRVKTIDLVSRTYWWPRMTRDIDEYVKACELCVRTKAPRSAPPGFLQPLPTPFRAWSDISVDYITPLPECERDGRKFKHIAVVVCRLTKMRHFIPMTSLSAEELATAFINRIYVLHGTPDTIVSDRGTQFVSEFWTQLSERLGVRLKHSSAFHPQTDGQTERVNAILEQYLRAFMNFHQDDWVDWLALAEFASNNVPSETTGVSPFFANYGFNPSIGIEPSNPRPPAQTPAQKREFLKANAIADRFERILTQLRALAAQSQRRYEENANASRTESPRYTVGQEVYVDTRNMKTNRPMKKGDDKWAGPYKITRVYPRACAVELPEGLRIFPVFHNSLLRPKASVKGLPGQDQINQAESKNIRGRILERDDETNEVVAKWEFEKLLDCHNEDGLHYLVKWKHHPPSWQPAKDLKGQNEVLIAFHTANPGKPGPPSWVRIGKPVPKPALRQSPRLRRAIHGLSRVSFAPLQYIQLF
jgi:transposase InsO family protein